MISQGAFSIGAREASTLVAWVCQQISAFLTNFFLMAQKLISQLFDISYNALVHILSPQRSDHRGVCHIVQIQNSFGCRAGAPGCPIHCSRAMEALPHGSRRILCYLRSPIAERCRQFLPVMDRMSLAIASRASALILLPSDVLPA